VRTTRSVRLSWAKLLKRLFEIDLEQCPYGGGGLKVIAAILEQPVIEKVLTHLGPQARASLRAPARGPQLQATWAPPANTFEAAGVQGRGDRLLHQLLIAEVWRRIARENARATATNDSLRGCDRSSTYSSWAQGPSQIPELRTGPVGRNKGVREPDPF